MSKETENMKGQYMIDCKCNRTIGHGITKTDGGWLLPEGTVLVQDVLDDNYYVLPDGCVLDNLGGVCVNNVKDAKLDYLRETSCMIVVCLVEHPEIIRKYTLGLATEGQLIFQEWLDELIEGESVADNFNRMSRELQD